MKGKQVFTALCAFGLTMALGCTAGFTALTGHAQTMDVTAEQDWKQGETSSETPGENEAPSENETPNEAPSEGETPNENETPNEGETPGEEPAPEAPVLTPEISAAETAYGDLVADALVTHFEATLAIINGVDIENIEGRVAVYGTITLGELVEDLQAAPANEGFLQIAGCSVTYTADYSRLVSVQVGEETVWNRVLGYAAGYDADFIYSCVINFIPNEGDTTEYDKVDEVIAAYLEGLTDEDLLGYQTSAGRTAYVRYAATEFYLENNYLYVAYEDGYIECIGPVKGADGEDGLDGAQGDPGKDAGAWFGIAGMVLGLAGLGLWVYEKLRQKRG